MIKVQEPNASGSYKKIQGALIQKISLKTKKFSRIKAILDLDVRLFLRTMHSIAKL